MWFLASEDRRELYYAVPFLCAAILRAMTENKTPDSTDIKVAIMPDARVAVGLTEPY